MSVVSMSVPHASPLHKKLLDLLHPRVKEAEKQQNKQHERWRKAEERVLAYIPESTDDRRRDIARNNGKPTYTTMQIPYTYALLMSAHTYITSVFFARNPIHQFAGRHGEGEQQIQAVEALMDYQIQVGQAIGPYYIWFYDALKYGLGITGSYWDREVRRFSTLSLDPMGKKALITQELMAYEGNRIYNVSPWDFYPDPRVPVGQFQQGEYCFVSRRASWNDLIKGKAQKRYINLDKISTQVGTTDPKEDAHSVLERPTGFTSPDGSKHPAIVEIYEVHIELIPNEWGLGSGDYPEKWVITVTKDLSVILCVSPLGCMHGQFPFDILEPEIEAYGSYNRGMPQIIEPLQNTMDWLVNTHFYNTRAILNNLFLVDPTKVVMKDFENSEPGGLIRLKPEAYGQDLRTFFYQVPMANITQQNIGDLQLVQQFGERALGINDQMMGAFQGGGRKTATEVRTSTGFGVNRMKTIAEYFSATGFSNHSQKLLSNSQQYYSGQKKLRIVGSLAMEAGMQFINVSPESIVGQYDLVPVDGTLPIDRMAQAGLWKEILFNVGRVPQIAMSYDLSRIFAWMASIAGLKNINQFKIQVLPPGMAPGAGMMPVQPGMLPASAPQSDTRQTGLSVPMGAT